MDCGLLMSRHKAEMSAAARGSILSPGLNPGSHNAPAPVDSSANVFFLSGHGTLLVDRPPVEIPEGVIFITLTEAGNNASIQDTEYLEQSKEIKDFLLAQPVPATEDGKQKYNALLFEKGFGAEAGYVGQSFVASFPGELTPDAKTLLSSEWADGGMKQAGIIQLYANPSAPLSAGKLIKRCALPFTVDSVIDHYAGAVYPTEENVRAVVSKPEERGPGSLFKEPKNLTGRHTTWSRPTFAVSLSELFEDIKEGGARFHVTPPVIETVGGNKIVRKHTVVIFGGCRRYRVPKFTMAGPIYEKAPYDVYKQLTPIKKIAARTNGNSAARAKVDALTMVQLLTQNEEGDTQLMTYLRNGELDAARRVLEILTNPETPGRPNERTVLQYIATQNQAGVSALDMAKRTKDGELISNLQNLSLPPHFTEVQRRPYRRDADELLLTRVRKTDIMDLLNVASGGLTFLLNLISNEHCEAASTLIERLTTNAKGGNQPDMPTIVEYVNRKDDYGKKAIDIAKTRCASHSLLKTLQTLNAEVSDYEPHALVTTVECDKAAVGFSEKYISSTVDKMTAANTAASTAASRMPGTTVDSEGNYYRIQGHTIVKAIKSSVPEAELGGEGSVLNSNRNEFRKFAGAAAQLSPDTTVKALVFAGKGEQGWKDGPVAEATFYDLKDILFDKGVFYIIDGNRIRIIENGKVRTLAGTGKEQSRDGWGLRANFSNPTQMSINVLGEVRVVDSNNRVRIIRRSKQALQFLLNKFAQPDTSIQEFESIVVELKLTLSISLKEHLEAKTMETLVALIQMFSKDVKKSELLISFLDRTVDNYVIDNVKTTHGVPSDTYLRDKIVDDKTLNDILLPIAESGTAILKDIIPLHTTSSDVIQPLFSCLSHFAHIPSGALSVVRLDFLTALRTLRFRYIDFPYMIFGVASLFAKLAATVEGYAYFLSQDADEITTLVLNILNQKVENTFNNCLIFLEIMASHETVRGAYASEVLVTKVSSMLYEFSENADVVFNGTKYLTVCARNDDTKELLVSSGRDASGRSTSIIPRLETIFEKFRTKLDICENASALMAKLTTNKNAQAQSRSMVSVLTRCLTSHVTSAALCESVSTALTNIASFNKQWVVGAEPALREALAKHTAAKCPVTAALLADIGSAGRVKYTMSASNSAALNELGLSEEDQATRGIAMPAIKEKADRVGRNAQALQLTRAATRNNNSPLEPLVNRVSGETFASERKRSRRTNRKHETRRRHDATRRLARKQRKSRRANRKRSTRRRRN